jgi:hypothetical protein
MVGDEIVVDGGMVRFIIQERSGPDVVARCIDPGLLLSRANLTFWRQGNLIRERNSMLPTISAKVRSGAFEVGEVRFDIAIETSANRLERFAIFCLDPGIGGWASSYIPNDLGSRIMSCSHTVWQFCNAVFNAPLRPPAGLDRHRLWHI